MGGLKLLESGVFSTSGRSPDASRSTIPSAVGTAAREEGTVGLVALGALPSLAWLNSQQGLGAL